MNGGNVESGSGPNAQRLHYPLDVSVTCVSWYVVYPVSLRRLKEMTAERGTRVNRLWSVSFKLDEITDAITKVRQGENGARRRLRL